MRLPIAEHSHNWAVVPTGVGKQVAQTPAVALHLIGVLTVRGLSRQSRNRPGHNIPGSRKAPYLRFHKYNAHVTVRRSCLLAKTRRVLLACVCVQSSGDQVARTQLKLLSSSPTHLSFSASLAPHPTAFLSYLHGDPQYRRDLSHPSLAKPTSPATLSPIHHHRRHLTHEHH